MTNKEDLKNWQLGVMIVVCVCGAIIWGSLALAVLKLCWVVILKDFS